MADIPSFPAFHRFHFSSQTAKESHNFMQFSLYSLSPYCGLLWLKYISYLSWKQQRKMSLSVRLLVHIDGMEPRRLFSRLQSWCQSFGEGRQHQGHRGQRGKPEAWISVCVPSSGPLCPRLELRDEKGNK